MKPLLDLGFVIIGIVTGIIVGGARLLDYFGDVEAPGIDFINDYQYLIGASFFIITILFLVYRRRTISCPCAHGIPHHHNLWLQACASFILAFLVYKLVVWIGERAL